MDDQYFIDKSRARASFGRAASAYDANAILQAEVREEMLSRLDLVKLDPKVILDAGCGTGLGSLALRKRFTNASVLSLDFALPMLALTKQNAKNTSVLNSLKSIFKSNQQHLLCADIEQLPVADASVGLVWSNVAIQWCNDLDRVFQHFHRVLQPEGLLMFSTFGPDTLKELRASNPNTSTSVSRFIDMHDIGDALVRAGFNAPVLDVERFTLTYDDVKAVMRDLKSIGAQNATEGRSRGLQGRGFLRTLAENYEQFRQADGKLPATFEVVYGHAWRSADKPDMPEGVSPIEFRPRAK